MDKENLLLLLLFGIAIICLGVIIVIFSSTNYQYEMPNGVICESKTELSFGGGYKFCNCEDNKTYLNPENWEEKQEVEE